MAKDPFESLALVPNHTDNFDEVWCVVNRANGRMVERFVKTLKEASCGQIRVILDDLVYMDSTVSYDNSQGIQAVSIDSSNVYTINIPSHGYSNGDTVTLRNVFGVANLNGTTWVIGNVTADTFELITQVS